MLKFPDTPGESVGVSISMVRDGTAYTQVRTFGEHLLTIEAWGLGLVLHDAEPVSAQERERLSATPPRTYLTASPQQDSELEAALSEASQKMAVYRSAPPPPKEGEEKKDISNQPRRAIDFASMIATIQAIIAIIQSLRKQQV